MRSIDEFNDSGGGGLDAALQYAHDTHIRTDDTGGPNILLDPNGPCPDGYNMDNSGVCMPIGVGIGLECGPGYHREGDTCVADMIFTPNALVCPAGSQNVNGVCVPTTLPHHDCSCLSGGTPTIDEGGNCSCSTPSGNPVVIHNLLCPTGWTNDGVKCIPPSQSITGNPLSDIEAKIKTFYTNNKGLSLAILAGAALLFLKK